LVVVIIVNRRVRLPSCTAQQRTEADVEDKMPGKICCTAPSLLEREKEGEASKLHRSIEIYR
jgi:hypothetical protein